MLATASVCLSVLSECTKLLQLLSHFQLSFSLTFTVTVLLLLFSVSYLDVPYILYFIALNSTSEFICARVLKAGSVITLYLVTLMIFVLVVIK